MKKQPKKHIELSAAKVLTAAATCKERAIDCGYAALAMAIEGKSWERTVFLNLMRRFGTVSQALTSCSSTVDSNHFV
jgi:hypothetical protein